MYDELALVNDINSEYLKYLEIGYKNQQVSDALENLKQIGKTIEKHGCEGVLMSCINGHSELSKLLGIPDENLTVEIITEEIGESVKKAFKWVMDKIIAIFRYIGNLIKKVMNIGVDSIDYRIKNMKFDMNKVVKDHGDKMTITDFDMVEFKAREETYINIMAPAADYISDKSQITLEVKTVSNHIVNRSKAKTVKLTQDKSSIDFDKLESEASVQLFTSMLYLKYFSNSKNDMLSVTRATTKRLHDANEKLSKLADDGIRSSMEASDEMDKVKTPAEKEQLEDRKKGLQFYATLFTKCTNALQKDIALYKAMFDDLFVQAEKLSKR